MFAMIIDEVGSPEILHAAQVPTPQPGPGEVLIRVVYAGVNPADWKNRQGMLAAFRPYHFPCIIGFDAAGTVAAVGDGVEGFDPGDRVFSPTNHGQGAQGSYAEYVVASSDRLAHMPAALRFDQAAVLPVAALTAWQGVFDRGLIQAGQHVLIHGGSGAVGGFAVQFARWAGAQVAASCSSANVGYLQSLGVHKVIDYTQEDIARQIAAWAPQGLDYLMDTVGVSTLPYALDLVRCGGTLVSIPTLVDDGDIETQLVQAEARGVRRVFSTMVDAGSAPTLEKIADLVVSGEIVLPPITEFPLREAAMVHRILEQGRNRGKVVLKVSDPDVTPVPAS